MVEHPKRPLKIYYRTLQYDDASYHHYWTNKLNFTRDEIKRAEVIPKNKCPPFVFEHRLDDLSLSRPVISFRQNATELQLRNYFPYPRFLDLKNGETLTPTAGGHGLGLYLGLKVLQHLRSQLPQDLRVVHSTKVPEMVTFLTKLGISPRGASHTLDQHIQLYSDRIREIEGKLRTRGHE